MKRLMITGILALMVVGTGQVNADSFGFYYRGNGFGAGMEFRDYDYYDRYSPGFHDRTDIDFHMALNPYGEWVWLDDFGGYIWIPNVTYTWRPYSYGTWTYTDYGWTWVAYEPWGWIPHHYGRWFFHPNHRWIWIPGYTWGPAYVQWGSYNGYYSWAPLPPRHCRYYSRYHRYNHRYRHNRNRSYYDRSSHWYGHQSDYESSSSRWIPNDAWVFVNEGDFMSDQIMEHVSDRATTSRILRSNHFVTLDRAPSTKMIEKVTGHKISRVKVDESVKKFNGKSVKIVRPVNILESNQTSVKHVQKKFSKKIDPNHSTKQIPKRYPNTSNNLKKSKTHIQSKPNSIKYPQKSKPGAVVNKPGKQSVKSTRKSQDRQSLKQKPTSNKNNRKWQKQSPAQTRNTGQHSLKKSKTKSLNMKKSQQKANPKKAPQKMKSNKKANQKQAPQKMKSNKKSSQKVNRGIKKSTPKPKKSVQHGKISP
jgi:Family of unknown function (DUF6600)